MWRLLSMFEHCSSLVANNPRRTKNPSTTRNRCWNSRIRGDLQKMGTDHIGKKYLITVDDYAVHQHKVHHGKMPGATTEEGLGSQCWRRCETANDLLPVLTQEGTRAHREPEPVDEIHEKRRRFGVTTSRTKGWRHMLPTTPSGWESKWIGHR